MPKSKRVKLNIDEKLHEDNGVSGPSIDKINPTKPNEHSDQLYDDYDYYNQYHEDEVGDEDQEYEAEEGFYDEYEVEMDQFPVGYSVELFNEMDFGLNDNQQPSEQLARGGLGSQALPVSDQLRADWDGNPIDGAEYLFTVRFAKKIPRVIIKEKPQEKPFLKQSRLIKSIIKSVEPDSGLSDLDYSRPSQAWRTQFLNHFISMRKSLNNHEPYHWELDEDYQRIPSANDRSNWKIFISGKKLLSDNNQFSSPKKPLPIFLKALEHSSVVAILSHYQSWISERISILIELVGQRSAQLEEKRDDDVPKNLVLISNHDGSWLLGLLLVLDELLTSDEIFNLRELARVCKSVVMISVNELRHQKETSEKDSKLLKIKFNDKISTTKHELAIGWMVLIIIVDFWGQKDLWQA
ncbi:survival motor neuron interacting protein 1-domain-containing protein [Phakopsora pachyrhizi]|nr:survival motor neuron interacting protein 1-domain-containing protein [Phakopsora pachyrhizi]